MAATSCSGGTERVKSEGPWTDLGNVRSPDGLWILIAEDDPDSRIILTSFLESWGYRVRAVATGTDALVEVDSDDPPAVVIVDWELPGTVGPEICRHIRARGDELCTYVLLLTARSGRTSFIQGMDAGADDFITKPVDPLELQIRLRAAMRMADAQRQLLAARNVMRDKAMRDGLTGLWNRETIVTRLRTELERCGREQSPASAILIDLDHFSRVNEDFGHLGGDAALREVAARLADSVRSYDAVGRYGGEELLVVLPGTSRADAMMLANRLLGAVREHPVHCSEGCIELTASAGVASVAGGEVVAPDELLRRADRALYQAKHAGRDQAVAAWALKASA